VELGKYEGIFCLGLGLAEISSGCLGQSSEQDDLIPFCS
jgi:hypothetical protein